MQGRNLFGGRAEVGRFVRVIDRNAPLEVNINICTDFITNKGSAKNTWGLIGSVKTRETMNEPLSSYFPDLLTSVNFYPYVQRVVTFKSVALWTTDNLHRDSLPV